MRENSFVITGFISKIWLVISCIVCFNLHTLLLASATISMTMTEYTEDRRMDCEGLNAVRLAAMILVLLGLETAI